MKTQTKASRAEVRRSRLGWSRAGIVTLIWAGGLLVGLLPLRSFAAGEDSRAAPAHADSLATSKNSKEKPTVAVSGFIQTNFVQPIDTSGDGNATNNRFRVNKVRIGFKGKVAKDVHYNVEVDPRSPTIMGVLRDAYIVLKHVPTHELRIGQQKTVFGYENSVSSTRLYTISRTELSEGPARGVTLRDIGIGVFGRVPLGGDFRLEDEIQVVNGAGMNVQADNNERKNVWGRVGVRQKTEDQMTRFGISFGVGDLFDEGDPEDPADDVTVDFHRLGVDIEIERPHFFVAAEAAKAWDNEKSAEEEVEETFFGYYLLVVAKAPGRVRPLARYDVYEDWNRLTLGVDYGLPDDDVRLLTNYEVRLSNDEGDRADDRLIVQLQVRFGK